ncbi:extracellular catalytic domain type 1 short-chain-length polyhydroxyalkanoate depolymerase [Phycicoccus avicenniae]|uniref:extracellular catalytic domain type 1 short-chain-length polyhydroxyalkanoate depolymerase n=1 Tax=Phycicoccus avicenniae TaxID=2828860 RepID=UPI003D2A5523
MTSTRSTTAAAALASTRAARVLVATLALALVGAVSLVAGSPPARAATLQQVTGFGSNPGALAMYSYRPDGLPSGAPLVVELHGCTQNASTYFASSGWREMADRYGFALVLAQQSSSNNSSSCFNWFQSADTARGQGEALSIKQMTDYAVSTYGLDSSRVYVTGLSAGAAMTSVMLATYPDTYAGGSINAGLPYRCATSTLDAFSCMNPGVDKSPSAWGDLVRAADPGYTGPRPLVSVWHGTSDTTVAPANATELRDQFTDVAGVSQSPTSTGTVASGVTFEDYAGRVRVQRVQGMGHGTAVDPGTGTTQCGTAGAYFIDTSVCAAYQDVLFFGLDDGTGSTPTPSGTPTTTPTPTPTPTATASPTCVTASNYAHVSAGRAHSSGGYAYANGSNQNLGLYNTFYSSTLRETSAGYWEKC